MTSKTKPCNTGQRHRWSFVRNTAVGSLRTHITTGQTTGQTTIYTTGRASLKALYKCAACGATKYDAANPNHPGDLRATIGATKTTRETA